MRSHAGSTRRGSRCSPSTIRHLGESGGEPRQVARVGEQLADWQAAIEYAGTLPEVDPGKIAAWAFSLSGGYIFPIAARNPQLAAAIAQTPNADGPAAARNAASYQKPLTMVHFAGQGDPRCAGKSHRQTATTRPARC